MAVTPDIGVAPFLADAPKLFEPHGRSSLLLIESLIHGLVDKGVLTLGEAIDIIDVASDLELELAHATNGDGSDGDGRDLAEFSPLSQIAKTLRNELGE